jgi:hypothetical protein
MLCLWGIRDETDDYALVTLVSLSEELDVFQSVFIVRLQLENSLVESESLIRPA